ncbi:MAG: FtsX-like permease family protein, partial [Candidatus Adiutrix sp.]
MSIERTIAFRYMRAKRRESFISLITFISIGGVGLGVASLIVVLAVLAGFESNLKDKFLGITSHIVVTGTSTNIEAWETLVPQIKEVPGVKSAEPFIYGQTLGSGPGGSSGVLVKGIAPHMAAQSGQLSAMNLSLGALSRLSAAPRDGFDEPLVILGAQLSSDILAFTHDQINLISPFGRINPLGTRMPLTRTYEVAGTFRSGLYEYDASTAYMTLDEARSLLAMPMGEVSTIEIMVDDIYKADQIKIAVLELIGHDKHRAVDWMQRNLALFAALKLEQAAMFVVLTLTIIVAAFNIVATLIMMVMEKNRDIAILKSMGATRRQIRRIFTLQGLAVGLTGAGGGLIMGVLVCLLLSRYKFISLPPDIYLMDSLPIEMRPYHLIATIGVTIAISFLATIYPANQAAKLDPLE